MCFHQTFSCERFLIVLSSIRFSPNVEVKCNQSRIDRMTSGLLRQFIPFTTPFTRVPSPKLLRRHQSAYLLKIIISMSVLLGCPSAKIH